MIRQVVSKLLFPTLERDLSKSLSTELATASKMMDCMLAPTVYGYEAASSVGGAFGQTASREVRKETLVKVQYYPTTGKGLFQ